MFKFINDALKALLAALGAFNAVLIGATQATDSSWSDVTLNTWLTALGAAIVMFNLVYWPPNNTPTEEKTK